MIRVSVSKINDFGIVLCTGISAIVVAAHAETMTFIPYLWVFMVLTLFMIMSTAMVIVAIVSVTRLFLKRKRASATHVILMQTVIFYAMYTICTAFLFIIIEGAAGSSYEQVARTCSFWSDTTRLGCANVNAILVFLQDQTIKGALFDFPEVVGVSLSEIEINRDNSILVLVLIVYRNTIAIGYAPICFYPIFEFVSNHVSLVNESTDRTRVTQLETP